jgi:cyanophycinase
MPGNKMLVASGFNHYRKTQTVMTQVRTPKGKLILIGGAEDKGSIEKPDISGKNIFYEPAEILKQLLPPKRSRKTIEIITTASGEPDTISQRYKEAFCSLGFKHVNFINMGNNYDAANPIFVNRIKKAHAVLFSGGDQFRLSTIMGNTDVLAATLNRYFNDEDFIVAGTSAGATAAAALMIFEGENNEAILRGTVKISSGLGFINGCIVDTHFTKRGRFGRLAQAVVMNPTCVGIGLGEDTALVVTKGRMASCIGSGMVTIIDGQMVGHTNMAYAEDGEPVSIEKLLVHILVKGSSFMLDTRTFVASKRDIKTENRLK